MFTKKTALKLCPLLNKPCMGSDCMWATRIRGTDPNTGHEIDEEGCAVAWLPTLLIDNSRNQNSTGAAIENFRNEMVQQNGELLRIQAANLLPKKR